MEITLLYFDDCPNWTSTDEMLADLVAERPDIHVTRRLVTTPEEAAETNFLGSPTVLIDGVDSFAGPDDRPGLACRVYRTPGGLAGAPTREQLVEAIARA